MITLGINTSLSTAEVVVLKNDNILAMDTDTQPFSQATSITSLLHNVLLDSHISFKEVDLLACSIGPGSFTGIRIGLAAAKGLKMALQKPLLGINIFEAIAYGYKDEAISVLIDSLRDDFFCQQFNEQGQTLTEPFLIEKDNFDSLSGRLIYAEEQENITSNLCFIAQNKYRANISSPALPMYIRPADVTVCKK